ncbi:MAG: hypothetical protein ACPGRX_02880 [Bdellovibrionales bacterium]
MISQSPVEQLRDLPAFIEQQRNWIFANPDDYEGFQTKLSPFAKAAGDVKQDYSEAISLVLSASQKMYEICSELDASSYIRLSQLTKLSANNFFKDFLHQDRGKVADLILEGIDHPNATAENRLLASLAAIKLGQFSFSRDKLEGLVENGIMYAQEAARESGLNRDAVKWVKDAAEAAIGPVNNMSLRLNGLVLKAERNMKPLESLIRFGCPIEPTFNS